MGSYLVLSIGLIFLLALISSFMRHRHLDRVLRKLDGFHVTVRVGSEQVWGKFNLYANAIELLFSQPYINHLGSRLTSYILFKEQMGSVEGVFRFHDELTPINQQRRLEEIERVRHPDLIRRAKRSVRNFAATFRDAISESIGLMASRVQQNTSMALLTKADGKLQDVGHNMLDLAANTAYDPVLEHYIFRRVVLEVNNSQGDIVEYCGILEEYSSGWVSILDCYLNTANEIALLDAERLLMQRNMDFQIRLEQGEDGVDFSVIISNKDLQDIRLQHISGVDSFEHKIGKTLKSGEVAEIYIPNLPAASLSNVDVKQLPISLSLVAPERQNTESLRHSAFDYPPLPELSLAFQTCRRVDIYIPRNKGVLRHGSEFVE